MSLDLAALRAALARHPRLARIVVAATAGSAPREAGAAMLVWEDGQEGTIGGGALELRATERARGLLAGGGAARADRMPLGPGLGQCCGGAVVLVTEVWEAGRLAAAETGPVFARRISGPAGPPLAVARILARARSSGDLPAASLVEGWLVEPLATPLCPVWIWGAGHVGRALVAVLAPLPGFEITWIDTAAGRFPQAIPEGVTPLTAANPADLVAHAPPGATHLVMTFSHALDLEICHRLLGHGFSEAGLIGSATKRARFRSRLAALGHPQAAIARIRCPIGDPSLGKHPQAIAIGVAAGLLKTRDSAAQSRERAG